MGDVWFKAATAVDTHK